VLLTGGQVNDSPLFPVVLDAIAVARVGAGRPVEIWPRPRFRTPLTRTTDLPTRPATVDS
jgi:hypothetical protein